MMNLLRDKSRNIQFEAFHVFKVSRYRFLHRISSSVLHQWRSCVGSPKAFEAPIWATGFV